MFTIKGAKMNKSEEFWDNASKNYDKTEERFEYIHSQSREKAKKHLKSSSIVLDYGCGTGTVSCELATQVKEVRAVDISSKMIQLAKEKAVDGAIENVTFEQADIFDTKYEKESYDVVLAFNMLHTVSNPKDVIQRINELIKPGGVFIAVTPCLRQRMSFLVNIQIYIVSFLCRLGIIPIPIRKLKSSDVDSLLKGTKFQTLESEEIYDGATSYFIAAKKKN